ncbi:hypothetical protein GCM10010507_54320 [Streptomyces cinnamoneus]|uniref:Uncharacterized protein n=1 Tax=Streptomyces cinnamoneus TaxID=53446 RepID=A0A918TY80_STRCJ|nr:hypothetical protein GCM10010507_54320 [Streptomyces cinnamoneus]
MSAKSRLARDSPSYRWEAPPARTLAALSGSPEYAQYEDDPPPCDLPQLPLGGAPGTRRRGPRPSGVRRYFADTP